MPSKDTVYTITKVAHEFEPSKLRPRFARMSELYLELLVNKKKVNVALAGEKYTHVYNLFRPPSETSLVSVRAVGNTKEKLHNTFTWQSEPSSEIFKISKPISSSPIEKDPTRYKRIKTSITKSYYDQYTKPDFDEDRRGGYSVNNNRDHRNTGDGYRAAEDRGGEYNRDHRNSGDRYRSAEDRGGEYNRDHRNSGDGYRASEDRGGGYSFNNNRDHRNGGDGYRAAEDRRRDYRDGERDDPGVGKPLPSLRDIKKTYTDNPQNVHVLEYENPTDTCAEDDKKRELMFKFTRLRKTYPKLEIPEYNMMSNYDNMQKTYDFTMKNLAVDSTVESYKSYLMMGFFGCEVVLGKIGFDMEGYSQQQTLHMTKYEKLLIELGEKSYVPSAINTWPVEVRLMVLILFQTTIFVVSKIIAKKTNVNVLQMYNNISGAQIPHSKQPTPPGGVSTSSGFASGGSSPLVFIPRKEPTIRTSETKMRGPSSATKRD